MRGLLETGEGTESPSRMTRRASRLFPIANFAGINRRPRSVMQGRNPLNDRTRRFEAAALPHLPAAYNLARWLLRDDQQAEDAVQEAYLRAFRFFDDLRGETPGPGCWASCATPATTGCASTAIWPTRSSSTSCATAASTSRHRSASGDGDPRMAWEQPCPRPARRCRDRGAGAAVPRGDRAARAGGDVVRRHRAHRRHSDRHRDVAPVARPGPAARCAAGGSARATHAGRKARCRHLTTTNWAR